MLRTTILFIVIGFSASSLNAAPLAFSRDVRPILSDHCFACHGPDEPHRKADLRLDEKSSAQAARKEILARVLSKDAHEQMPPKSGRPLSPAQIDTLKQWVEAGAPWEDHWAFVPPRRSPVPVVSGANVRNPIDAFIASAWRSHGLQGSPEADRATLIRRVTLDLTGVPPSPEQVDAFVRDRSADAYDKVVDRLLGSSRYGERMAWRWLEAARYADTSGYQSDGDRAMWRWRDWVIDAYNANLPFDRFLTDQLAGDLLPNPTLEQRIATGFNRNHRGNSEGGIVPAEYAVEYVVDRVDTTATVFMGLTLGCARCHDHKYDPFSQREFYQLFAFFNNIPEKGRALKFGNSPPYIEAPTPAQQREWEQLRMQSTRLADRVARVFGLSPEIAAKWEAALPPNADWQPTRRLSSHYALDDGIAPLQSRDGVVNHQPAIVGRGVRFDGKVVLEDAKAGNFGFLDRFTLSCWVRPESLNGPILTRMVDDEEGEGYGIVLVDGRVRVVMTKRWLDDALRVETEQRLKPNRWVHVAVRYDGSRVGEGVRIFIDGEEQPQRVLLDELNQTFTTDQPFRIGGGAGSRFRGLIDEVRIYSDDLDEPSIQALAAREPLGVIVRLKERTPVQEAKRQLAFLEQGAPAEYRDAWTALQRHQERTKQFRAQMPTVMVMEELPTPRPAHILVRGQYDRPGERVDRAVPKILPSLPKDAPRDRLGLAQWLTHPAHPLTARVAVNRVWQLHFGIGLVKTTEDFGVQGEPPSHPELLDWLATEFMRSGWDVKHLHRMIVTSATYRQSSRVTPNLLAKDPDNRWLARGPRMRLSAEMVRDQALAVSGLLVEEMGGPSVKPYQPAGLWTELTGGVDYVRDHGDKLYRRSLYTYWKRTIAPPGMAAFDAAGREACVVRESRTNTPLQALTLLNDVAFVEAARVLAQRVLMETPTESERLPRMFRRVLGRAPSEAELRLLLNALDAQRTAFRADPSAAKRWIAIGDFPVPARIDPVELAAHGNIAALLLNLDETITKE